MGQHIVIAAAHSPVPRKGQARCTPRAWMVRARTGQDTEILRRQHYKVNNRPGKSNMATEQMILDCSLSDSVVLLKLLINHCTGSEVHEQELQAKPTTTCSPTGLK